MSLLFVLAFFLFFFFFFFIYNLIKNYEKAFTNDQSQLMSTMRKSINNQKAFFLGYWNITLWTISEQLANEKKILLRSSLYFDRLYYDPCFLDVFEWDFVC